jgi:hypothetical protein
VITVYPMATRQSQVPQKPTKLLFPNQALYQAEPQPVLPMNKDPKPPCPVWAIFSIVPNAIP